MTPQDPFGDHDDAELNDALQSSGLGSIRHSETGVSTPQRLTLETQISAGGSNLSQGQRQLVALARALVRNSKVFILDEVGWGLSVRSSCLRVACSSTLDTLRHRVRVHRVLGVTGLRREPLHCTFSLFAARSYTTTHCSLCPFACNPSRCSPPTFRSSRVPCLSVYRVSVDRVVAHFALLCRLPPLSTLRPTR